MIAHCTVPESRLIIDGLISFTVHSRKKRQTVVRRSRLVGDSLAFGSGGLALSATSTARCIELSLFSLFSLFSHFSHFSLFSLSFLSLSFFLCVRLTTLIRSWDTPLSNGPY
jgi:hypothetical protein